MGHAPLVAPVLEVQRLSGPAPDLDGVGALAFTSANGVIAFAEVSAARGLPVFAVGEATARAAERAGFANIRSAGGDVQAMIAFVCAHAGDLSGTLLHPGASEPAGDLAGALRAAGVATRLHPLYTTVTAPLNLAAMAALRARPVELDGVLVHSPRAAQRLAEMDAVLAAASELSAYCISQAAAAPLERLKFARVTVAPLPNEAALLNLIAS